MSNKDKKRVKTGGRQKGSGDFTRQIVVRTTETQYQAYKRVGAEYVREALDNSDNQ